MRSKRNKVLILGTSEYAEVLVDTFECLDTVEFDGFLENRARSRIGSKLLSFPVYWSDESDHLSKTHLLTTALATTQRKAWIEDRVRAGFDFITLVHPSSSVSKRTTLGTGSIVDAGVVVAGFSKIASHVRIGRRSSIGHHTEIGEFSTIHPGVLISGRCKIGRQVTVGTGAILIEDIVVGDGAFIAAGSVVTRDVIPGALVAGNPGRIVKKNYGPQ